MAIPVCGGGGGDAGKSQGINSEAVACIEFLATLTAEVAAEKPAMQAERDLAEARAGYERKRGGRSSGPANYSCQGTGLVL